MTVTITFERHSEWRNLDPFPTYANLKLEKLGQFVLNYSKKVVISNILHNMYKGDEMITTRVRTKKHVKFWDILRNI